MKVDFQVQHTPYSPEQLRDWYYDAIDSPTASKRMWLKLQNYHGRDGLHLAYKATSMCLEAKHIWNPMEKYMNLKESMPLFKRAVEADPENTEIRFLRFSIQHYIPAFVGISGDLENDKKSFLTYLPKYQNTFPLRQLETMTGFFLKSGRCSRDERELLEKVMGRR